MVKKRKSEHLSRRVAIIETNEKYHPIVELDNNFEKNLKKALKKGKLVYEKTFDEPNHTERTEGVTSLIRYTDFSNKLGYFNEQEFDQYLSNHRKKIRPSLENHSNKDIVGLLETRSYNPNFKPQMR